MEEIAKLYSKTNSDSIRISYIGNIGFWDVGCTPLSAQYSYMKGEKMANKKTNTIK